MTDQPQPPPYNDQPVVVQQLGVTTKQPARVPRPRGLATVVLAIVVAVLAGYIAVLLIDASNGRDERRQLACEVQRLGGRPIGKVDCPRPSPTVRPSPRPAASRTTAPAPVVVVVSPSQLRGPAGPPGPPGRAPRATPAPGASRPPASPTARPSPTPSCRAPNPLPTGPRCLLQQGARRP